MPPFLRTLLTRHEPVRDVAEHAKSALGAVAAILVIGGLAYVTALPLLLAPLGATAVILFGYPGGALAQPVNVFGGYLLAPTVGVATAMVFPGAVVDDSAGRGVDAVWNADVAHHASAGGRDPCTGAADARRQRDTFRDADGRVRRDAGACGCRALAAAPPGLSCATQVQTPAKDGRAP